MKKGNVNVWHYAILRMAAESHRILLSNPNSNGEWRRNYEMVRIGRQLLHRLELQGVEVPRVDPFSLVNVPADYNAASSAVR